MTKRFVILSGPACVGKGPLQSVVRKLYPGLIDARPVLCTSRPPRKGEIHGQDFYFLPASLIKSLENNPAFAVSPVRTDWQAIDLYQVERLLMAKEIDLVFAEVFYTFGPPLLQRACKLEFECIRIFLHPLPLNTPETIIIDEMRAKLTRRGTEKPDKITDRAAAAPREMEKASTYTHRILNPAGEDDAGEWKCYGTVGGSKGTGDVNSLSDLGPNARWLVEIFVRILNGEMPPGDYKR